MNINAFISPAGLDKRWPPAKPELPESSRHVPPKPVNGSHMVGKVMPHKAAQDASKALPPKPGITEPHNTVSPRPADARAPPSPRSGLKERNNVLQSPPPRPSKGGMSLPPTPHTVVQSPLPSLPGRSELTSLQLCLLLSLMFIILGGQRVLLF